MKWIVTFILLASFAHAQVSGTPLGTTGLPAPMLYGNNDPVTLGYPCDASHLGIPFYNMSASIARPIWICNGTNWLQAQAAILGSTASFGGALILLGGTVTSTATVTGAPVGSNCSATRADGTFLAVGLVIDCAVSTAGIATVRISAIIAGTPTAGIYNVRVFP